MVAKYAVIDYIRNMPLSHSKNFTLFVLSIVVLISGAVIYFWDFPKQEAKASFEELSQNGNSSCSVSFNDLIDSMPDSARLQGSCCSKMSMHRYNEQVAGLQKYKDIPEIPPDPYDIDANLAKKLKANYDVQLSLEEQKAYDYAMENSMEKGPCCCKCWRWYVYGGLGKLLIQKYNFTGEQVTEVWNLSDGCGGDEEHHH